MWNVNFNNHCSFNKSLRILFHKKQRLNNSSGYTEEEIEELTKEIENEIYISWKNIKADLKGNKG